MQMREFYLGLLGTPSSAKILETVWKMREEVENLCEHDEDEDGPFVFNVYGNPDLNSNEGKIKRVFLSETDKLEVMPEWMDEADKIRVDIGDVPWYCYSYYILEVDRVWYRHVETKSGSRVDIVQADNAWYRHYQNGASPALLEELTPPKDDGLYLWY